MNFLFVNTHTRTTWMKQETRSVACAVLLESSGQVQWFEAKSWDLHIEENSQTLRTTPWRVMMHNHTNGGRDSLLVRAPDLWSKGCEFESRQERREHFLLQSELCVLTLIRCPFHPRVTAVARKGPGHSAKSADGRLHLNMHTSWTQRSRSGLTVPLFRHSVGPIRKLVHTQLVRIHSATVVYARWATVDWS